MIGTILYNLGKLLIYPISHADVVISEASGSELSVEDNLKDLWKAVSDLTGESEAADNIKVLIGYYIGNTKELSEIKLLDDGLWSDTFELPDTSNPYVWKKTVYTYKGDTNLVNKTYEIVAAYVNDTILTIYIAKTTGSAPVISYPILKDGYGKPILDEDGNELIDLTAFDTKLPEGWSEDPVSVSPSTPYVFMSTRKKVDGLWEKFSNPALYGRWAFDSLLEIRYTITTSEVPTVDSLNTDPGSIWSSDTPNSFTGKLWMITATSVNGVLNQDENGTIWHGPHLMSIIQ